MKVLKRKIPVDEIQVGDCMWAVLDVGAGTSQQWRRRCQLVEICGNILRVETGTRKGLVPILKSQVCEGEVWGYREE